MNFAMAPAKKLMNNVGRTMTIVCTIFVTERTWDEIVWQKEKKIYTESESESHYKYQVDSQQALSPKESGDDKEGVKCKGK